MSHVVPVLPPDSDFDFESESDSVSGSDFDSGSGSDFDFQASFHPYIEKVHVALKEHLQKVILKKSSISSPLGESMYYTTCTAGGGKRFRPLLSLLTAEALGVEQKKALPLAISLELIHTYSLIHDDLPSMDNDIERRGKKCNHLVLEKAWLFWLAMLF